MPLATDLLGELYSSHWYYTKSCDWIMTSSTRISGSNTWRYVSTICQAIFSWDIPANIGLIYIYIYMSYIWIYMVFLYMDIYIYGRYLLHESLPVALTSWLVSWSMATKTSQRVDLQPATWPGCWFQRVWDARVTLWLCQNNYGKSP